APKTRGSHRNPTGRDRGAGRIRRNRAPDRGRAMKPRLTVLILAAGLTIGVDLTLSPRWPGGEGGVRGAGEQDRGIAHLTLPSRSLSSSRAPSGRAGDGPLPLPPGGRRGAFAAEGRIEAKQVEAGAGKRILYYRDPMGK